MRAIELNTVHKQTGTSEDKDNPGNELDLIYRRLEESNFEQNYGYF